MIPLNCINGWRVQGPNLTWENLYPRMMKGEKMPIYIHTHPCMGDHIICAGIYRVLSKHWQVNVLVREGDAPKVCMLMQGIPGAGTVSMPDNEMTAWCSQLQNAIVVRLGDYSRLPFDHNRFDVDFYQHAGVDFRHRWDSFRVPDCEQLPVPKGEYAFVHDRPELMTPAGYSKLPMDGVRPDPKQNIFAYRDIILGASTLHCVSSAFAAFADSLDLSGKELNFYSFGREVPTHKQNWKLWRP